MSYPSIAIVGAGLGGLVLARILQMRDIPCTVYELDSAADARQQGGLLDLHEKSGQFALRTAGLYEEFRRLVQPQGEAMRILDKAGTVFIDYAPRADEWGRPEIDRTALRDLLIASLDPGRIAWGQKVTHVSSLGGARHALAFADGRTVSTDLLVGADGTWSKVRPLLSAMTPKYCGIAHVELRLSDVKERHPDCAALVGPGIFFALSDQKALMAHGGKHIHLGALLRAPEDWTATVGVDWSDAPAARKTLLAEFGDWSAELTNLIRNCDDTIIPRPIHALPTDHSWARTPGVTLLRDAAHVMSPFAGEGANLAMLDATELALAIVSHDGDVESAFEPARGRHVPSQHGGSRTVRRGSRNMFRGGRSPGNGQSLRGHGNTKAALNDPRRSGDAPLAALTRTRSSLAASRSRHRPPG